MRILEIESGRPCVRNEIVLEETGDATTVRQVTDVVITYGLTAAGLFALT
jgi:hypothetical protein